MTRLILYGTQGCHLCDDAELLLNVTLSNYAAKFALQNIDIADHENLLSQYAIRIPVLYHPETRLELNWPFDGEMLAKFLNQLHDQQ